MSNCFVKVNELCHSFHVCKLWHFTYLKCQTTVISLCEMSNCVLQTILRTDELTCGDAQILKKSMYVNESCHIWTRAMRHVAFYRCMYVHMNWLAATPASERMLEASVNVNQSCCVYVSHGTYGWVMANVDETCHVMGWLRLVGSLKLYVSFAKEPYKTDYILQKRHIISRSILIISTP